MATSRFVRRAAMRGSLSATLAAILAAPLGRGRRAALAAAAGGLVAGAAQEEPAVGAASGAVALLALGRGRGARRDTLAILGLGAAVGVATRRLWPVAPHSPADVRRAATRAQAIESADGTGVSIVVNSGAGSASGGSLVDDLRRRLPRAAILERADHDDLTELLEKAAADSAVLGIVGGDGSINAAAAVAHARGLPLLAIPGGTLNHFARDLGVTGIDDAADGLADGHGVAVDLATIDGHPFLNTASFGAYADLVDARERLEARLGKWPAMMIALVRVLHRAAPCEVEVDGRPRRLWMVFIGNCRYHPHGFAPTWRERLDDGSLDVRLVDATHPCARTRLVLAVLTGRLGRSAVYEEWTATRIDIKSDGPLRLARDGETFDGSRSVVVAKTERPLVVYAPAPPPS